MQREKKQPFLLTHAVGLLLLARLSSISVSLLQHDRKWAGGWPEGEGRWREWATWRWRNERCWYRSPANCLHRAPRRKIATKQNQQYPHSMFQQFQRDPGLQRTMMSRTKAMTSEKSKTSMKTLCVGTLRAWCTARKVQDTNKNGIMIWKKNVLERWMFSKTMRGCYILWVTNFQEKKSTHRKGTEHC